jgi:hypothetical protein
VQGRGRKAPLFSLGSRHGKARLLRAGFCLFVFEEIGGQGELVEFCVFLQSLFFGLVDLNRDALGFSVSGSLKRPLFPGLDGDEVFVVWHGIINL